jgi:hypothetical protein
MVLICTAIIHLFNFPELARAKLPTSRSYGDEKGLKVSFHPSSASFARLHCSMFIFIATYLRMQPVPGRPDHVIYLRSCRCTWPRGGDNPNLMRFPPGQRSEICLRCFWRRREQEISDDEEVADMMASWQILRRHWRCSGSTTFLVLAFQTCTRSISLVFLRFSFRELFFRFPILDHHANSYMILFTHLFAAPKKIQEYSNKK